MRDFKSHRLAIYLILTIAASYALYLVISQRWMADDAFISFRYARNLTLGHGLVFNPGERVEGYTNFLWTVLIAGSMKLGFEPIIASWILSIAFYLGTVATFVIVSWRWSQESDTKLFVPIAALCLLVHHESHIYATSGMETAAVTFLVSLAFALLLTSRSDRALLLTGITLSLAALTRPDALIFAAGALIFVALHSRISLKRLTLVTAPLVFMYLPYWLWRFDYYGYLFPNTYYAKSGGSAYFSQGLTYLQTYLNAYYVLGLFPLALILLFRLNKQGSGKLVGQPGSRWMAALIALFTVPYLFYVARVGGDFMFGRFLIPITGIMFFALEACIVRTGLRKTIAYGLAALVVGTVVFRWDQFTVSKLKHGIADEPAFYPLSWTERARETGEKMARMFEGADVRVAFYGMYAVWVYYANPQMAIEGSTGLTDSYLAHRPISNRGRPGHEKPAPVEYLLERGVHFLFRGGIHRRSQYDLLKLIHFGPQRFWLLTYDREMMDHLGTFDDVRFTRYPEFLDKYEPTLRTLSKPEAESIMEFSREYYFDHTPDPDRLARMKVLIDSLPDRR